MQAVAITIEVGEDVGDVDAGPTAGHRSVAAVPAPSEHRNAPQRLGVVGERGAQSRQVVELGVVAAIAAHLVRPPQHVCHGPDRQGEQPIVVPHHQAVANDVELQFAAFHHRAVVVAEDGEKESVGHVVGAVLPVDVEPVRISARPAETEHVPPLLVVGVRSHVVGHHVEDESEAALVQRGDHPPEPVLAPQLVVEQVVVDHVVAVRRAGDGIEHRRGVDVRHAELVEVVDEECDVGEAEVGGQLESVGGDERWCRQRHPADSTGTRPALRIS